MRKLKFHEKKLLKKVDFLQWKNEHNLRELSAMRRYHIQDRDDYKKYNKLCGMVTRMARRASHPSPRRRDAARGRPTPLQQP